jgi:hypothetical protein
MALQHTSGEVWGVLLKNFDFFWVQRLRFALFTTWCLVQHVRPHTIAHHFTSSTRKLLLYQHHTLKHVEKALDLSSDRILNEWTLKHGITYKALQAFPSFVELLSFVQFHHIYMCIVSIQRLPLTILNQKTSYTFFCLVNYNLSLNLPLQIHINTSWHGHYHFSPKSSARTYWNYHHQAVEIFSTAPLGYGGLYVAKTRTFM